MSSSHVEPLLAINDTCVLLALEAHCHLSVNHANIRPINKPELNSTK